MLFIITQMFHVSFLQVWYTNAHHISAADATNTNPTLHQSLEGVEFDHCSTGIHDQSYNQKLLGKWKYSLGLTTTIPYYLDYQNTSNRITMVLKKRGRKGK